MMDIIVKHGYPILVLQFPGVALESDAVAGRDFGVTKEPNADERRD
jgi:hypothetical protein